MAAPKNGVRLFALNRAQQGVKIMPEETTNTLERPGEFDALPKLRPDEPYFVLLGRDRTAPTLVQAWADGNRYKAFCEHSDGKINDARLEVELRQSTDAERIGWAMRAYKTGAKEIESDPIPAKPTYTGHVLSEDQQRKDAVQRGRSRSISAMHNAVAELDDTAAAFAGMGMVDEQAMCVALIETLKDHARALAPPKPGQ